MNAIARTVAALRIIGDDLEPKEVSELLGVEPTISARKGDGLATGSWYLRSEERLPGDVNAQVQELLGRTTANLAVWRSLSNRFQCDVFCGLFMVKGNESGDLEPGILLALGERGLRLGLDIYDRAPEGSL